MEQQPLQDFIARLCTRPGAYISDGSFKMAAVFIDGYMMGVNQTTGQNWEETEWNGFRLWLADRCSQSHGLARNLGWSFYVTRLFPDDTMRFEQLPRLYGDYLAWAAEGHNARQYFYQKWLA